MLENFSLLSIPNDKIPSDPRFGVGPSKVPAGHIETLLKSGSEYLGTSHRKSNVIKIVEEAQAGLKNYFHLPQDYMVVFGNGGASIVWDMIGLGMTQKKSLHYVWGEFSQKSYKSAKKIPWISAVEIKAAMGEAITPEVKDGADVICYPLNETSTGVQMTKAASSSSNDALICVDATSGAGQIKIDLSKVDIYYFSPQKVFAADGGLFVAFLSPKAQARAKQIAQDTNRFIPMFMEWTSHMEYAVKGQTPTTPSLANIWLLNEQVKLMNQLGEDKICELAKEKAKWMYDWAENKNYLSCFVKNPELRSQAVATIDLDEKFPVAPIVEWLKKNKVAYDIEGYRQLNRNQFRISMFHNVLKEDLEKLTWILSKMIES
ncbi:MAG: aminotransferase class V-fold PLP-dependent enzyme [Bacteriovoracaceae bacterium]|nr:aminotransferase class V-fold PLP-dependent enzyme [Bacteriovoracaceae bacterium]